MKRGIAQLYSVRSWPHLMAPKKGSPFFIIRRGTSVFPKPLEVTDDVRQEISAELPLDQLDQLIELINDQIRTLKLQ